MHSVLAPVPQLGPARRLKKAHAVFQFLPQVIAIYFVLRMNMELISYIGVSIPKQAIRKFANRYPNTNQAAHSYS